MPASLYLSQVLTGLSTTNGYPTYFPDLTRPTFAVSIATVVNSTTVAFTVEHTMGYTGSSAFVSTAATWYPSSGTVAAATNSFTAYNYPVSAIRLNSTAGSSTGTITMTVVQVG